MGLAIDGNEVHGIAHGGQAFVSLGNASFNITEIDTENDTSGSENSSITFTNLNNFSEYSFYQIRLEDKDMNENTDSVSLDNITSLFLIKPNVQMNIATLGNMDSLTINVFANNNGIKVSCNCNNDYWTRKYILYGYKIN